MMDGTTIPFTLQLPREMPFAFSVQALLARLQTLTDKRTPRGIRYPLEVLLLVAVLARLAGQRRLEPLADWARLRAAERAARFGLKRATMLHQRTGSRVLGHAVDVVEREPVRSDVCHAQPATAEVPPRGRSVLTSAGTTVRGTIPTGQTRGVHLLAA